MECYLFVFPVVPTRFLSNHDAFDLFVGWGMTYMAEKEMRKGKYPLSWKLQSKSSVSVRAESTRHAQLLCYCISWEDTEKGWPENSGGTSCSTPESWKGGKALHLMEKKHCHEKNSSLEMTAGVCFLTAWKQNSATCTPEMIWITFAKSEERSCRHNKCCLFQSSHVTHLLVQVSSEWL